MTPLQMTSRRMNRLKDEVYREMFRLECSRPGAEMGLALALLRAWSLRSLQREGESDWDWLATICPICLKIIEESLDRGCKAVALHKDCSSGAAQ